MSKFDFDSPQSHAFTNINNGVFCAISPWGNESAVSDVLSFRDELIRLGDLRHSDVEFIQIDTDYELIASNLNKLRKPKILIIQLPVGDDSKAHEFVSKVCIPRKNNLKSTVLLTDCTDLDGKVSLDYIILTLMTDKHTSDIKERKFENFLFLDIDGPLLSYRESLRTRWACTHVSAFLENPVASMYAFDQIALNFLRKICARHKVGIVLCSQWRIGLSELGAMSLGRYLGLPIFDVTRSFGQRSEEINEWIEKNNPIGKIIVIDDEKYEVKQGTHIHIDPKNGITWEKMSEITDIFNDDIFEYTSSKFNYFK